jgi:hypothetical protein
MNQPQQFGNLKLKPMTSQDIEKLDQPLPPIPEQQPDENDIFVQARKMAKPQTSEVQEKAKPKDELEDKALNMHPILKKLKSKLGIDRVTIHKKTILVDEDVFEFGFTEYPEDLNIWCLTESRNQLIRGETEEKAMSTYNILRVGCSLVSINDFPSYEVYGIEPREGEVPVNNAFLLSDRLRKAVAVEFNQFITKEGVAFVDILEQFWQEKVLSRVNIISGNGLAPDENLYVCEVAGCSFVHTGSNKKDHYCIEHGVKLKKSLTSTEKESLPLA